MASIETLTMAAGSDRAWLLTAIDPDDGTPAKGLLISDALTAAAWPGDDRPTTFAPTVTWFDPPNAVYRLAVSAAQTAGMRPGILRLQARIARGAASTVAFDGRLELTAAPGVAASSPVYGTYDDMLTYAGWLGRLQAESDQYGFAEQRARARSWLDEAIVSRYKPLQGSLSPADPGYTAWMMAGDSVPSKWLRDQLAADRLIVGDLTREIVAKKAIGYVCAAQLGGLDKTPYQGLAYQYDRDASALLKTYRAVIDINGDGYAEVVIHCGMTNLR